MYDETTLFLSSFTLMLLFETLIFDSLNKMVNFWKRLETKVVKIAFWLVKSYDFTSQNMHYGLNRTTKSKMSKIGLKSGKIAKIGWNRAKSRSQDRLYDFNIIVALKVPPMSTCQTPIGISFSHSRDSSVFGLRLFANSHPIHLLCIC